MGTALSRVGRRHRRNLGKGVTVLLGRTNSRIILKQQSVTSFASCILAAPPCRKAQKREVHPILPGLAIGEKIVSGRTLLFIEL